MDTVETAELGQTMSDDITAAVVKEDKKQTAMETEVIRQAKLAYAKGLYGLKVELEFNLFDGDRGCDEGDEWDVEACHNWLLDYMGLSIGDVLIYSEVYDDTSVDTEWTFTLSLKDPKTILLLPKFITACHALAAEIGVGLDTENAGMHMAFILDPHCYYKSDLPQSAKDLNRFKNFRKSMAQMMPALFFLSASNSQTREMHFRMPRCGQSRYTDHAESHSIARYDGEQKYSAVHFVGSAVEFRVFDPCYDNAEQIFDNFIVMRNCMRFWSDNYRSPKLEKLIADMNFGFSYERSCGSVSDMYKTFNHVDVLNAGIRKLKPSYRTIAELKQQRGFKVTKRAIKQRHAERKAKAARKYALEKSNKQAEILTYQHRHYAEIAESLYYRMTEEQRIAADFEDIRSKAALDTERWVANQKPFDTLEEYVEKLMTDWNNNDNSGALRLAV